MASFQTYLRSLSYAPRDRAYEGAKEWMARREKLFDSNELNVYCDKETRERVVNIAVSSEEFSDARELVSELACLVPTKADDSIHLPELQKIIEEAIAYMKTSCDPFHEVAHIIRAIRFASLIYKKLLAENQTLDWGIIVAALAWHDVYRVKNRGFLYNKNTRLRKALRKIPWLIDIDIYLVFKKDSIGSALMFLKESKRRLPIKQAGLSKDLRRKIAIAILGEHTLNPLQESIYPGISLYKSIIFSADTLDLASIGRLHDGWRCVKERGLMDMRWYNRMLVLNILFGLPRVESHPSFSVARDFYQIIKQSTYAYVSRFFPTDAKFLRDHFHCSPRATSDNKITSPPR